MGGGGVMRAAAKVARVGIVNTSLRAGVQEFAGGIEEDVAMVGSTDVSSRGEPMARVLFGGVPSLDEAKEATADLKVALDKAYLSTPHLDGLAQVSRQSLLSNPEETKDCVASDVKAVSLPKSAIQAFKLLNESSAVQSVVASIATDPNVWNAVMNNLEYIEFIQSYKTNEFEDHGSHQSSEPSVKVEDYFDASQPKDSENPFSDFLQKMKTNVVEMVNKATDLVQSLFTSTSENPQEDAGSSYFDKKIGTSLMGLALMVIVVVVLKRA
ncbi:hypothetical protein DITRI_Ditri14bG0126100 [Diplodiscus trichospermus]